MDYSTNPFQELYVADTVKKDHFVKLFSHIPMQSLTEFHQLFNQGNLVLEGSQGSGKTMLLSLFRPEIRIAYEEQNDEEYPIPEDKRNFISAGINLTKSRITHLADVTLGKNEAHDIRELPHYFGDFFNYKVILDLIKNIELIASKPNVFGSEIVNLDKVETFLETLLVQDCWSGALNKCTTLVELKTQIKERLACYRNWMAHNTNDEVPSLIKESKSTIGEPIIRTVACLKEAGIIADIPVFIRIDQIEELVHAHTQTLKNLGYAFRKILNEAFSNRDLRVNYRIGTRPYGWNGDPELLQVNKGGVLEEERDFKLINFDSVWARKESIANNRGFESFAADAFERRIKYYLGGEYVLPETEKLLKAVFGKSAQIKDQTEVIFGNKKIITEDYKRPLALNEKKESAQWSPQWKTYLKKLYLKDPLQAVLAAAWGRQTGDKKGPQNEHRNNPPPKTKELPWNRVWWKKERLRIAVLQLCARRQQRLMWWGEKDILDLSGGNILAFLGMCHGIWDQFLRNEQQLSKEDRTNPLNGQSIEKKLQAAGIQDASRVWYNKLAEHKPEGDIRQRFINQLGVHLRKSLRDDKSMSYPGGNGFSIKEIDLNNDSPMNRDVFKLLKQSVGWSALVMRDHTTKESKGDHRLKFYLHPILSPVFQIPVAHTKEPLYWKIDDVVKILKRAEIPFIQDTPQPPPKPSSSKKATTNPNQMELPIQ